MQMFNQNPDPDAVAKAKEALKVCPALPLACNIHETVLLDCEHVIPAALGCLHMSKKPTLPNSSHPGGMSRAHTAPAKEEPDQALDWGSLSRVS